MRRAAQPEKAIMRYFATCSMHTTVCVLHHLLCNRHPRIVEFTIRLNETVKRFQNV